MVTRNGYEFEYFFNAGLDWRTLECDVEGVDVLKDRNYIGSIRWKTEEDILNMTDAEFENTLTELFNTLARIL
jgi:hypothetical protein